MLGDRIKKLREQAGITSQELAELANVSQPYISQIENNRRQPSYNTLLAIANALNTPIEHLAMTNKIIKYPVGIAGQSTANGSSVTQDTHSQYYPSTPPPSLNTNPRPHRGSISLDALVDYALAIENARRANISPDELYEAVEALKKLKRLQEKR